MSSSCKLFLEWSISIADVYQGRRFYGHADMLKARLEAFPNVEWTTMMERAFADAKTALCKTALLAHPLQGWELALVVEASADCV
jgi:hypothetical protein